MVAEAYADWGQGAEHPTKRRFVSMARRLLPNGGVAIDLGCGTGEHVTAELAEHFDTIGVDISAHSIDLARQRVPSARFVVADMTTVDFPHATVDLVTAFYSVIHVPRQEHANLLRRIVGWLVPGGILILTMGAHEDEGMAKDWLGAPMFWSSWGTQKNKDLITQAGFELLSAQPVTDLEDDAEVTHLWIVARRPS